jgi:hypothetical protein
MLDDLRQCLDDAQEVTSSIEAPELRREAFKIVLSKLLDLRLRANSTLPANSKASIQNGTVSTTEAKANELPVISPANSTASNVRSIFATGWAASRRTVNEINMALDANGVPDPKHISTVLTRLVESKELLRIKQGDVFVYWRNPVYASSEGEV